MDDLKLNSAAGLRTQVSGLNALAPSWPLRPGTGRGPIPRRIRLEMRDLFSLHCKACQHATAAWLISVFIVFAPCLPAFAQPALSGQGKGFRVADYYDAKAGRTNQMKMLLTGDTARPLAGQPGRYEIQGLRLVTFREAGPTNLVASAPQCFFNFFSRDLFSDGPLTALAANSRFSIEGQGFLWGETNSLLIISNQVHTRVQKPAGRTNRASRLTSSLPAPPPPTATEPIDIRSRTFVYNMHSGEATYRQQVSVTNPPSFVLTCEQLQASLNVISNQIQTLVAESNLVIHLTDKQPGQITGDKAVYRSANGQDAVTITGNPAWQFEKMEGRADELLLQPQDFTAYGHGWLVLAGGFAPVTDLGTHTPPGSQGAANRQREPIVLSFDEGSFHPGTVLFSGHVNAWQTNQWHLTSDRLTAQLDSKSNRLEQLIAEPNAHIVLQSQDDTVRAQGDRMRYWIATNSDTFLEITGQPSWGSDKFEGRSDRLLIQAARREYQANGHVFIKLLPPKPATNATSTPTRAATNRFRLGDQPIEIRAEEGSMKPGNGRFQDQVRISHPDWQLGCDTVSFTLDPTNNQVRSLEATGHIALISHLRTKTAAAAKTNNLSPTFLGVPGTNAPPWKLTCDRIIATADSHGQQIDRIEGQRNVVIEQGGIRITSGKLVYTLTNGWIRLTETPILTHTNGSQLIGSTNTVLIIDDEQGHFNVEGDYHITVPTSLLSRTNSAKRKP